MTDLDEIARGLAESQAAQHRLAALLTIERLLERYPVELLRDCDYPPLQGALDDYLACQEAARDEAAFNKFVKLCDPLAAVRHEQFSLNEEAESGPNPN